MWRNHTTIQRQLSILVSLSVAVVMMLMVVYNYLAQANSNKEQQISAMSRVLELERQQLDDYISELRTFSLQLRNNSEFMSILTQTTPLDYEQRQIIENALKAIFYSRRDLLTYDLYLINIDTCFSMNSKLRKVSTSENITALNFAGYDQFTSKPDFCSIMQDEGDGFLSITRGIVNSPQDTLLAVVRFTVNDDIISSMSQSHIAQGEYLCLVDERQNIYYSGIDLDSESMPSRLTDLSVESSSFSTKINGIDMLCISAKSNYSLYLAALKPKAVINAYLNTTRNLSIVLGIALAMFAMLLVIYWVRFITTPLSELAHRLRSVGSGNFKTKAHLEGSYEIIGLSEDVNNMIESVNTLIESTYIAELNERTAKLVALEAQMNPHFLFNTLQAISTQAIVNKQEGIYKMVTALAGILRYTIRGGNLTTLDTELDNIEKYLMLQQARFGDKLTYELIVDAGLRELNVPKLGVLSLAENSIVHGFTNDVDTIHVKIQCSVLHSNVYLSVSDSGYGIRPDKIEELRVALDKPTTFNPQNIGLTNLASRLKLLYNGSARIKITSSDAPRQTKITMIIPLEVMKNVQSTDH